ncbi:MAG TPA: RIP metalloprotease RseP [Spirochaetota bacterium]|nr:RIP metalloprotease RseP [Spirochaetota bacterium]HOR45193.1 RIP metalloprotease RseP [Spirochaetota bacterium]HPK56927.1 RIP metalloprotease RseP [Spirochaetota bacterium]
MFQNLGNILGYVVPALILLGCCVFVHELGHLLGGRLVGIRAKVFSIGFGRAIIKKKIGDTVYQIAIIPFGGYCAFEGEDAAKERKGEKDEFFSASPWRRLVAVIMGPLFNLIFGILLFFIMNMSGYLTETNRIIIPQFFKDSGISVPAAKAGLADGDRIVAIDGKEITSFNDIMMNISLGDGKEVALTVDRNGEKKEIKVTPEKSASQSFYSIGVMPWGERVLVNDVTDKEPAASAGFKKMDEIKSADGKAIKDEDSLKAVIKANPGKIIKFEVVRSGKSIMIEMTPRLKESFVIEEAESNLKLKTIRYDNFDTFKKSMIDGKVSIEGNKVLNIEMLKNASIITAGRAVEVITPEATIKGKIKYLQEGFAGITYSRAPELDLVKFPLGKSLSKAFVDPVDFIEKNLKSFGMLFSGKINVRENLSGPIMIAKLAGDTAHHRGISSFIVLMAKISIILMIMNLLPIPAVDGSYVIFFVWEGITKKPLSDKIMGYIQYAGFIFIMALSALVLLNDVVKLWF